MSRLVFALVLELLVLCFANQVLSAVAPEDCVDFDVSELESYLSRLNLRDVPSTRSMTGGFKCPVNALPYGALKSDWARLMLLQEAQPEESSLRPKLDRLFRLLAVAYFQMEEKFDVTFEHADTTAYSTNAISNASTEDLYKSSEENGANHLASSAEGIGITKKEYPLASSGQITWRNSSATVEGNQETSEPLMYPEGTSTIATSYRDPMEKMRRPQILGKPPSRMNEFWNYVVIPKRVVPSSTLASIGPLSARGDEVTVARGDETTSALHASLNSNAQKIFRWFYSPDRGTAFNAVVSETGSKVGCQARGKDKSCCS